MIASPSLDGQRRAASTFGEVMQLSYVPADPPGAIRFWTRTMGVGPFFHMPDLRFPDLTYRGRPSDAIFSASIAYWGDLQIEVIEQHNDGPSVYRDWRKAGHAGVQHICVRVPDLDAALTTAVAIGMDPVQRMSLGAGGRVAFVDTGGGPGTMIELLQPRAGSDQMFENWKAAARDWDGRDPVRPAAGTTKIDNENR